MWGASGLCSEISAGSGMDEGGQRGRLKPGALGTSPLTESLGHCAPCENSRQKNANNLMIPLHVPSASSGFTGRVSPDSALAPSSAPCSCRGCKFHSRPSQQTPEGLAAPRPALAGWERLGHGDQGHPRGYSALGPGQGHSYLQLQPLMEMRSRRKRHWLLPRAHIPPLK